MRLLKDHYGNAFKIATALINKHIFSLFLVTCYNAVEDVDYMDELDNPANMRVVIAHLPYKVREKWRAWAFDTGERK